MVSSTFNPTIQSTLVIPGSLSFRHSYFTKYKVQYTEPSFLCGKHEGFVFCKKYDENDDWEENVEEKRMLKRNDIQKYHSFN